jgi:DNA-binding Lrp family transcriptional regulator
MDSIDKGIIVDLMRNARVPYQEMANKYGLSANAIKNRIKKLFEVGIFKEYYIELSNAMISAESFVCYVDTDCSEDINEFADQLGSDPRIHSIAPSSRGRYAVHGIYLTGPTGLSELGSFIRSFPFVKKIELFPVLSHPGKQVQLSTTELEILAHLINSPRMPISEIARKSGIAPGMISDLLNNLINAGIIETGVRLFPNTGDFLSFVFRIHFDDKAISVQKLISWIKQEFPDEYVLPAHISAIQPSFSVVFAVNKLNEINGITQSIRQHHSVFRTSIFIWEPIHFYPGLKTIRLKELIKEAGLEK